MSETELPTASETFRWVDPAVALAELPRLSGLDYLTGILDGRIPPPPISALMRMDIVSVRPGEVVFESRPTQAHFNPLGGVHGGLACTVLDTVLACAGHTTLGAGVGYTSIDIAVSYLRPIRPDAGPLRATGRVVKAGSRVIFTEGEILDRNGDVLATATSSLLVLAAR
ncbi:PaaI family thioesterase [Rathayibacter sp. YIM 133350]|uniref:PaaI family thioesterase n=1 Tax=Rathayibacter sp. YIM 133350 TaxID=3131992 RepID=UPI00307D5064